MAGRGPPRICAPHRLFRALARGLCLPSQIPGDGGRIHPVCTSQVASQTTAPAGFGTPGELGAWGSMLKSLHHVAGAAGGLRAERLSPAQPNTCKSGPAAHMAKATSGREKPPVHVGDTGTPTGSHGGFHYLSKVQKSRKTLLPSVSRAARGLNSE